MRPLFLIAMWSSATLVAQQEVAFEPPPLDRPLIFDSSTRGPGGGKSSHLHLRFLS